MTSKPGPRELALREQRERESAALEKWADDKRRAAKRNKPKPQTKKARP